MREVRWERMFRDELEEAFAACPLLYLPYGLCEPHGPGNALGLDGLKAHGLACKAAHRSGGIVAPAYFWHIHEIGLEGAWAVEAIGEVERAWLTALPPWMFFKNVLYHVRMADMLGFHAAIILTGHGGPLVDDLKRLVALVQPSVGARLFATIESQAEVAAIGALDLNDSHHAGKEETSLLWAIEPDGVDMSRIPEERTGPPFALAADVMRSNRRDGERMAEKIAEWLGEKGRELLAARVGGGPRLRTFEEVEVLWETVVKPELKSFNTMQNLFEDQVPPPTNSVWYANWEVPQRG